MITPSSLAIILQGAPFPAAAVAVTPGGAALDLTVGDKTITFCEGAWFAAERRTTPAHLSFAATPTAEQVHAEIRRVLAVLAAEPSPPRQATPGEDKSPWKQITGTYWVGPDLPGADPYIPTLAEIADEPPLEDALHDRLTDEVDRRRDVEAQLAQVTAERDAERIRWGDQIQERDTRIRALEVERDAARADLAKMTDAHAVVSQRLAGAQREVADLESALAGARDNADRLQRDLDFMNQRRANAQKRVADLEQQRDEYQAAVEVQRTRANVNHNRADKAEARVKRLLRQRRAAHAVLDEAGVGLEVEGSPQWTLARRCRAAVKPVWGYLDALQAFDVVGETVGVTGKTGDRGFFDAVIARVKALHNDDDLRAAIAVAVGLDGSASLSLILDTVKDRSPDLLRLVSYHQAPIKFADRPLTLAERACFVIRRLWQGRANATNEAASLRRELGDIADALGDLPDTAEREPIGDREEHLGLSTAERIRLSR